MHRPVSTRELVEILSPYRRPPLYGYVFQSEDEKSRQWEKLSEWAKANGLWLDDVQQELLRSGDAIGNGEEHWVYLHHPHVIKETRDDSWAAGATPAQYFQRWLDIGYLWPALEAEVIGVSDGAIWVSQPFIEGELYTNTTELDRDMAEAGWEKSGKNRYTETATGSIIRDARPSNFIKDADGLLRPFDVVVEEIGSANSST